MRQTSVKFSRNSECAHAWAHQNVDGGKGSNFFFEGPTIYSWGHHFPIATVAGRYVFFTTETYSMSTAAHMELVRSAISHKQIINVPVVPIGINPENDIVNQRKNLMYWLKQLVELAQGYAENPRKKSLLNEFSNVQNMIRAYSAAVNLTVPEDLQQALSQPTIQEMAVFAEKEEKKRKIRKDRRDTAAFRAYLRKLRKWEIDGRGSVSSSGVPNGKSNLAYLRWNAEDEVVETSKGIRVEASQAFLCWQYIQRRLTDGDSSKYTIKGFQIESVTADGILVGCHQIPIRQVQKIAQQMGWLQQ